MFFWSFSVYMVPGFLPFFLCVDNSVSGPQDQLIRGNGNGLGILKFASYLNQFVSEKVGYCPLGHL